MSQQPRPPASPSNSSGASVNAASNSAERGFSLLEVLVATALLVLIGFVGLAACRTVAGVLWSSAIARFASDPVERQAEQFTADAATAFAVFVPAGSNGSEVDFYAKAGDGGALFWRYVYDPAAHTLQRWDFDRNGSAGVRDIVTGALDTGAAYPPLLGVVTFRATEIAAGALGDPSLNRYAGVAALFAHPPQSFAVRYTAAEANAPAASGGNGIVAIELADAATSRVIHLAAGSMPAGFTVSGALVWHAVVYRVDQSHRFLLGPAGKSHVFVNAHVDVSYNHWVKRIPWCDFNLLGNPGGLDPHDPHADYKPNEAIERSDSILAACLQRHPIVPAADSAGYAPDPDAVHPPLPGQTPPPCWANPGPAGRCWPMNAPPDWTPPEPLPSDVPPPDWCATHARSVACDGAVGRVAQGR
jgi:prepilin-type N-terminal cleavage/methylation domain-containing protein